MPPKRSETTPLLWAEGTMFPNSGSVPPTDSYPAASGNSQPWLNPQAYQYFQSSMAGAERPRRFEFNGNLGKDPHSQFCALTGCPPTNAPPGFKYRPNDKTLYGRVIYLAQEQNLTYNLTAALTNFLLLMQIVLGAVLTGLGGTHIPRFWITLIGATNTVIAGIVAYLKSRGQPMRARMFRDDLERLVCEIENSEVMWLGISKNVHGYDDIDTTKDVTVRSEVARLTRLFDKAVLANSANNPDLYSVGNEPSSSKPTQNTNVVAIPIDRSQIKDNAPSTMSGPQQGNDDDAPAVASGSKTKDDEAKKKAEEDKKKKDEEDKKKKAEEDKNKKDEEDKQKQNQTSSQTGQTGQSGQNTKTQTSTSTSSDDKGKGTMDMSSISNSARQFFSSSTSGGTKSSETKTETSGQTSSKQTGSGSGNFGLEDP